MHAARRKKLGQQRMDAGLLQGRQHAVGDFAIDDFHSMEGRSGKPFGLNTCWIFWRQPGA
ncbi:hypothetical protein D3C86_1994360 [compost metagenome]